MDSKEKISSIMVMIGIVGGAIFALCIGAAAVIAAVSLLD